MDTRRIGSLVVSVIGVGCNNFGSSVDYTGTQQIVDAAIDSGITFFDTADIYGRAHGEELLGRALGHRRNRAVIATKFGWGMDGKLKGGRPEYVKHAAEQSLRRLRTDYIDLYYLHTPDPHVPIGDTLDALGDLISSGKVREAAFANCTGAMLADANGVPNRPVRFAAVQNEYNLLERAAEQELFPACRRLQAAFVPYSPLANGLLSGKYAAGLPLPEGSRIARVPRLARALDDEILRKVEALRSFAQGAGHTLLELAISWLLARPEVPSVIAGATSTDQVRANAKAANWPLTGCEMATIDSLTATASGAAPAC